MYLSPFISYKAANNHWTALKKKTPYKVLDRGSDNQVFTKEFTVQFERQTYSVTEGKRQYTAEALMDEQADFRRNTGEIQHLRYTHTHTQEPFGV